MSSGSSCVFSPFSVRSAFSSSPSGVFPEEAAAAAETDKKRGTKKNPADLDLEDYLEQMQQMKKMGSLQSVLGMLPGVGAKLKDVEISDDVMKKPEAIIRSMTPQERHHPEVLNASRRKRIARGAGVTVQDVNQLIRQYDQARQMVKSMMGNKRGALRQLRNFGK